VVAAPFRTFALSHFRTSTLPFTYSVLPSYFLAPALRTLTLPDAGGALPCLAS
jgi:hypothetical protein